MRLNGVVPFTVKGSTEKIESSQFVIRNLDACRIGIAILDSRHGQAFLGGGMRDELKNHLKRGERCGTPVHGNERKEPMFNFVPLAGCWGIMSDRNRQVLFVGKILELFFPEPVSCSVGAATVGS